MVTPSLPRGNNQTGQAPLITDPPQTRKEAQNNCVVVTDNKRAALNKLELELAIIKMHKQLRCKEGGE